MSETTRWTAQAHGGIDEAVAAAYAEAAALCDEIAARDEGPGATAAGICAEAIRRACREWHREEAETHETALGWHKREGG